MSKDTTGEFQRGYVLGFKHGKEYKAESSHHETTTNNDSVLTKDNTLYNYYGNFRTYDEAKDEVLKKEARKDLFNDLLWDSTKMRLLSRLTCSISDVTLTPMQKRFVKYYFNRTEAGELIIPVVKMRQAGMTDILSEILFREYMAGKRVVYCAPNPNFAKDVKKTFERKRTCTNFAPVDGGSFDAFGISDWQQFNGRIARDKYDVIVVDEIGTTANFTQYFQTLHDYALSNNAIVVFAFTPTPGFKHYEDMQKTIETLECNGRIVYRYNAIAPHILRAIRNSAKLDDNDDRFTSALIEMLGMI